jgi:hypothetical protein
MNVRPAKAVGFIFLFLLLTVLTQVGGLVLLGWLPLRRMIDAKMPNGFLKRVTKLLGLLALHLVVTFLLVPPLARLWGRVPLPVRGTAHVAPLTVWTCLLNRHYVKPALGQSLYEAARQLHAAFPGTQVAYLDANFPFFDGFPLWPHLSHYDGNKLDLAFFYREARTRERLSGRAPSPIGYGVFEGPAPGETDTPADCAARGYWQYGLLGYLIPQGKKETMRFDAQRTRRLIQLLIAQPGVGKLFIEPHLKTRLGLRSEKVRFHGCGAVRHDDHIHIQR